MSRSAVTKWLADVSSYDVGLEAVKPTFVVMKNVTGAGTFTQIFKRSEHSDWAEEGILDRLMAGATPAGGKRLSRAISARTVRPALLGDGLLVAPISALSASRFNQVQPQSSLELVTGRTAQEWAAGMNNFSSPVNLGVDIADDVMYPLPGMSLSEPFDPSWFIARAPYRAIDKQFREAGFKPGSAPKLFIIPETPLTDRKLWETMYALAGPGRVVVTLGSPLSAGGEGDRMVLYWDYPAADDSFVMINGGLLFRYPTNSLQMGFGASNAWDSADIESIPTGVEIDAGFAAVEALTGRLNPAYAQTGLDVLNMSSHYALDDFYLPLMTSAGEHELFFRSDADNVIATMSVGEKFDVLTLVMTQCEIAGVIPVSWYLGYVARQVADGVSNEAELTRAVADMGAYVDKDITFLSYTSSLMLPVNIVELTRLYQDYAEAKEKACEDNDFMSREFITGMTYGTLQTLVNGSRNVQTFFGYRDALQATAFVAPLTSDELAMRGYTVEASVDPLVVQTQGGVTVSTIVFGDVESLASVLSEGARLKGATADVLAARWGVSGTAFSAQLDGQTALMERVDGLQKMGSVNNPYDFRWGSAGITGLPDYLAVDLHESYRIAMISKGVVGKAGAKFLTLLKSELTTEYTNTIAGLV